jgi:hypothetical protein
MHKILASCLVASVLLTACNSGSSTRRSQASAPPSLPGLTTSPGNKVAASAATAPVVPAPVASNTASVTPSAGTAAVSTAKGTNPPHGQPGHRCDVAVGAPLDGSAAPSVTLPTPAQQTTNTTITPTTAAVTTPAPATPAVAKGKNPAHGQPGHRCDIAVGAPLDSKPGTGMPVPTTTQPAANASAAAAPAVTPATNASGVRINPPHGQPGHNCSVQVGQPLPSNK